ncbi:short-chain dehydrogenase reductase family 16c member 6 [Colletotrichum incanum]|uniref:Short-chain dehydrogenase/reductase 3 n=1 Tax=Colletotrichum incanum TaxID=1573173 RepID=A0A161Y8V7_COLIC|nr:short-chain dehydrogenase reductase family 16c member 6 [Colletotrichum incanum]
MSTLIQLLHQCVPAATNLTKSPKVQAAAATLCLMGLLPRMNEWLSNRRANNYVSDKSWDWSKEIIVVTGGSSGIGANIVEILECRNVRTIILDLNPPAAKTGSNVSFYQVDLSDASAISEVAKRIRAEHGDPSVLINNAGIGNAKPILKISETKLQKLFGVNLIAPFLLVQQFLPSMVARNHGHVVNIASMASFSTQACNVDYAASKVGLLAFHEGLKQELRHVYDAPAVRATVIHPTWVRTPMIRKLCETGKLRGPTVNATDVARAVVNQIFNGYGAQVCVPSSLGWMSMIRGLPVWLQESLRDTTTRSLLAAIEDSR